MLSEFRYAIHSLWKSPRFSMITVLALGIGIGANTAMFSVVYNVLLRPLAYPRADRLVFIQETGLRTGGTSPTAPATYADWRDQQNVFQSIAAAELWGVSLTGSGRPEQIDGLRASASLLDVLKVQPAVGRGFLPDEDHVVLLSDSLWQRRFGADRGVIGRTLTVNGSEYRVIGVMPKGFRFPPFWALKAELWAPLIFEPDRAHSRSFRSLRVFARMKDGITLQRVSTEMSAIARRLEMAYPQTNSDRGAKVMPLEEAVVGNVRPALLVLLGAVGFLLLIACANVANLLLARASARQREIAVRVAIGASRWRLVRQLLAESFTLSLAGAGLGLLLAAWAVHALTAAIPEASRFTLPRYQEVGIGAAVLLFTLGVSAGTAILFGLVPALQFSRPDLNSALKESGRGWSGPSRGRLRNSLVVAEVAISLMLLSGAGLMVRSLVRLGAIDPGFDARNVLTMTIHVTGSPYDTPEKRNVFYRAVLEKVAAITGVTQASAINHLPLAGDLWTFSFFVEGRPIPPPQDQPGAVFRVVFPEYFGAMRIPLRGRDFNERDNENAPRVAVINQTMARRYWPGEDALGKRFRLDANGPWVTIVGVAKDAEQWEWGSAADPEFYFPYRQNSADISEYITLVLKTAADPQALAGAVERAVWSLDPDAPIADVQTMEQVVNRAVWQPRFSTALLGGFAGLALLLAAIGIYCVISYTVSRRGREIGIQMALGARPADVLLALLSEGARLALAGGALGIAGALLLTRYLSTLLYQMSATDPAVMIIAAAALGIVALAATWLPARRATRVDPAIALRSE
jgi:putative ABC transport system permease protein